MNIPRIINYLKENHLIKGDAISSDLLSDVLLVTDDSLFQSLLPLMERPILFHDIHKRVKSGRLFDLAYDLLNWKVQIPLNLVPKKELKVRVNHDIIDDDLDLGIIKLQWDDIDWENSIEEHDIKLKKSGLNSVYERLAPAKYYPNLRFSIVK